MNPHDEIVMELRKLLALREQETVVEDELDQLKIRQYEVRSKLKTEMQNQSYLVDDWICWFEGSADQFRQVKVANLDPATTDTDKEALE